MTDTVGRLKGEVGDLTLEHVQLERQVKDMKRRKTLLEAELTLLEGQKAGFVTLNMELDSAEKKATGLEVIVVLFPNAFLAPVSPW